MKSVSGRYPIRGSSHIETLAYRDDSLIGTILQWMLFFGKYTVHVMLDHTSAELFKYRKLFHFLIGILQIILQSDCVFISKKQCLLIG